MPLRTAFSMSKQKFQQLTLFAHRGASFYAPENTLIALEFAKKLGATWAEFDVQLTIDNVPIVFHDDNLTRVGRIWEQEQWQKINDTKNIFELPWAFLQQINVGMWFKEIRAEAAELIDLTNIHIPTLVQYFTLAKQLGFSLNLELKVPDKLYEPDQQEVLKTYRQQLLAKTFEALDEVQWPIENIIFSSFDLTLVKMAADSQRLYHSPAALYWHDWPKDRFQFAIDTQCSAVNLQAEMLLNHPDPLALAELSKHAIPINTYTVNDAATAERLIDITKSFGCELNGIFTDNLKAFI